MEDICKWTEIPKDHCPHCTGDLSEFDVVCNHGRQATDCQLCAAGAPREDRGTRPERITLVDVMMGALKLEEREYETVLGPCPGCQSWQLDYTSEVAATYAEINVEAVYELWSDEPVSTHPVVDAAPFHAVIEDALREHLEECPHLQRLIG